LLFFVPEAVVFYPTPTPGIRVAVHRQLPLEVPEVLPGVLPEVLARVADRTSMELRTLQFGLSTEQMMGVQMGVQMEERQTDADGEQPVRGFRSEQT